jgi:hypothetical protein
MKFNKIWQYYDRLDLNNKTFYLAYHDELLSLCQDFNQCEDKQEAEQYVKRAKAIIKAQTILNKNQTN